MHKICINLIFVTILLGGIILSTGLMAESSEPPSITPTGAIGNVLKTTPTGAIGSILKYMPFPETEPIDEEPVHHYPPWGIVEQELTISKCLGDD